MAISHVPWILRFRFESEGINDRNSIIPIYININIILIQDDMLLYSGPFEYLEQMR